MTVPVEVLILKNVNIEAISEKITEIKCLQRNYRCSTYIRSDHNISSTN